jgi:hypothetical protein
LCLGLMVWVVVAGLVSSTFPRERLVAFVGAMYAPLVAAVGRLGGRGRRRLRQVRAGIARIACMIVVKSACQGQRAGRRRVQRRLVRVSRPGMERRCRRRASAVWTGALGRPIMVVQRARLCASAAITVHALLA